MRDGAMVIKWKADGTYDTLRPGTNRLMCYDQSGDAGEQPVSSQCTSVGNLERVKQNKIYEAKIADRKEREAAFVKRVDQFVGRGRRLGENPEPAEWIHAFVDRENALGDGGPADPVEAITACDEVASHLVIGVVMAETHHRRF